MTIHSGVESKTNDVEAKLNVSVGDVPAEQLRKLGAAFTETVALFNQIMPEKVELVQVEQKRLAEFADRKHGVILTGKSQAGKSTLLNGLLGCSLLPTGHIDEEANEKPEFNSAVSRIPVEVIRVPHVESGSIELEYHKIEEDQYESWIRARNAAVQFEPSSNEATRSRQMAASLLAQKLLDAIPKEWKYEHPLPFPTRFSSVQEASATLRKYIRGHNIHASAILSHITIKGVFPSSMLPFNLPIFDVSEDSRQDFVQFPLAIVVASCGDIGQKLELHDSTMSFKTCVVASKWATNATINTNRLSTDEARLADYNKTKEKFHAAVVSLAKEETFSSDKIKIVLVDRHSDHLFGLDSLYRDELESVVEMMRSLGTNVWKEIRDGLSKLCNDLTLQEENNELSAVRAARDKLKTDLESLQWPSMSSHDPELIAQELFALFQFEFDDQNYSWQSIRAFWSNRGVHYGQRASNVPSSFATHLIGKIYSTQIESLYENFAKVLENYCKEMGTIIRPNLPLYYFSTEFPGFRRDLARIISDQMSPWYNPTLDPFGFPSRCLESMNGYIKNTAKVWLATYQSMFEQRVEKLKKRVDEVVNQTTQISEMKVRAFELKQALDMSMLPARQVKLITKLLECLELVPLEAEARTTPVFKDGLLTISEYVISDIEPVRSLLAQKIQTVQKIQLRFCNLTDAKLKRLLFGVWPLPFLQSIDVTGNFLTADSAPLLALAAQVGCALNKIPPEIAYGSLKHKYPRPQQNICSRDSPRIKKLAVVLEADEEKSMGCKAEVTSMTNMLRLANYKIFRTFPVRLAAPRPRHNYSQDSTHNPRKHWEDLKVWLKAELPQDEPSVLVFFYAGHGAKTVIGETLIDSTHQQRFFLCELFPLIPPRCNSFFLLMCCRTPDELARYVLTDEHGNEYTTEETFAAALGEELKENPEKYAVPKLYMALSPPEGTGCEATADETISQEFSIVQALLQESYINRVSLCDQFRKGPQSSLNKRPLMLSETPGMDQNITF